MAKEFLREQHADRLIPRRLLEQLDRYDLPKMQVDSVDEVIEEFEIGKKNRYDTLNTGIFVEIYKEK